MLKYCYDLCCHYYKISINFGNLLALVLYISRLRFVLFQPWSWDFFRAHLNKIWVEQSRMLPNQWPGQLVNILVHNVTSTSGTKNEEEKTSSQQRNACINPLYSYLGRVLHMLSWLKVLPPGVTMENECIVLHLATGTMSPFQHSLTILSLFYLVKWFHLTIYNTTFSRFKFLRNLQFIHLKIS